MRSRSQGKPHDLVMEARLGIDDFIVRKACAIMALGFTVLPMMYCEEELANGRLVQLLPNGRCPAAGCRRCTRIGAACCRRCAPGSITWKKALKAAETACYENDRSTSRRLLPGLPGAREDYKWGGVRVFSIAGNKMFALQGLRGDSLAFKVDKDLFLGHCDRPAFIRRRIWRGRSGSS
jgi:hypothetical protein